MAVFFGHLFRLPRGYALLSKANYFRINNHLASYSTVVEQPKRRVFLKISLFSAAFGAIVGTIYSFKEINKTRENIARQGLTVPIEELKYKPPITPSRKIISSVDTTGLKLTLFQYQTCPFCCKVRVLLDYYGLSYDVVEVDPVLRKEIAWSSYKKVPILLVKTSKGYQPLNDSSMIVSVLTTYLNDKSDKIEDLVTYYPNVFLEDNNGNFKNEIINKYYLMYKKSVPEDKTLNERNWRKWADEVFVHMLSPNVYRTLGESYKTFQWFSQTGKWEEYFPLWERLVIINVGAIAMWLIGKRLKKRHQLKDDVRQSLYDEVNNWLHEINARGTQFMGGQEPGLSDLAVYGILNSIEGCDAFQDTLNATNLGSWYNAVKEKVNMHAGCKYLTS
ncbi:hypothetical protein KM043_018709 [Ampulex compressa]|nr:hypothetical protein KM043_018709 [Ampulex compressa]